MLPVATMAAVGLDCLCHRAETHGPMVRAAVYLGVLALIGVLIASGERETVGLRRQFLILSDEDPEPRDLIPELGRAMRSRFGSEDVAVICNFLPTYGPQLHYYAQHEILGCVFTPEEWRETIADPENAPLGGVIWLGDPEAEAIVASLPAGTQERVLICDIPFCFWRPDATEGSAGGQDSGR
jgi:hypothetical protein